MPSYCAMLLKMNPDNFFYLVPTGDMPGPFTIKNEDLMHCGLEMHNDNELYTTQSNAILHNFSAFDRGGKIAYRRLKVYKRQKPKCSGELFKVRNCRTSGISPQLFAWA